MNLQYALLLLLLAQYTNAHCQPTLYNQHHLFTQNLHLHINNHTHTYTYKINMPRIPQTALAINRIHTQSDLTETISLRVQAYDIGNNEMKLRSVTNNKTKVSMISISVWVSNNKHIYFGAAFKEYGESLIDKKDYSFRVKYMGDIAITKNTILRSFITGFQCSHIGIRVANSYLNQQITLNVTLSRPSFQIHTISINFVLFNINNNEFSAYGGSINTQTLDYNQQYVDILKTYSATQNLFFGFSSIENHNIVNGQPYYTNLNANVNHDFYLSYQTSHLANFNLFYIVLGYRGDQVCQQCNQRYNLSVYNNGYCTNACSSSQFEMILSNGGKMCRSCYQNEEVVNGICKEVSPGVQTYTPNQPSTIAHQHSQSVAQPPYSPSTSTTLNPQLIPTILYPSITAYQNTSSQSISTTTSQPINTPIPLPKSQPHQTTGSSISNHIIQALGITNLPLHKTTTTSHYQVTCALTNSYWNGFQCVCQVSFVFVNGNCIEYKMLSNCGPNSYFSGLSCLCNSGYQPINNVCSLCPQHSNWNGSACLCDKQYARISSQCLRINSTICPSSSYDNGLGICVCVSNLMMVNRTCVANTSNTQCQPNGYLLNGNCVCDRGFIKIENRCSRCPPSAFWSSESQRCVFVCGINAFFSVDGGKCMCQRGFGIRGEERCQKCLVNEFVREGHCVKCLINAFYNARTQACDCQSGYYLSQSFVCLQKCNSRQVYNPVTTACDCKPQFSQVNGSCQSFSCNVRQWNPQICASCPSDRIFSNGVCKCLQGLIMRNNECISCFTITNAFLLEGICAVCQSNKVYNTASKSCDCPAGKTWAVNKCIQTCSSDGILDVDGVCFSCGLNKISVGGICQCRSGYKPNLCGGCDLHCLSGQFIFEGQCAVCPFFMVFQPLISGCICPQGSYMSSITNSCEKLLIDNVICPNSSYLDKAKNQCTACPSNCSTCFSLMQCRSCKDGFLLNVGICQQVQRPSSVCGDGIIQGNQTCDSGNVIQTGCVNCRTVSGYTCVGRPSTCVLNRPSNSLQLVGQISANSNNIFLTLKTFRVFTFPNPTEMGRFLKVTFSNGVRPTVYCSQRSSSLINFDCLFIFSSGIPNNRFNATFSYNYEQSQGSLIVSIDSRALASSLNTRRP